MTGVCTPIVGFVQDKISPPSPAETHRQRFNLYESLGNVDELQLGY